MYPQNKLLTTQKTSLNKHSIFTFMFWKRKCVAKPSQTSEHLAHHMIARDLNLRKQNKQQPPKNMMCKWLKSRMHNRCAKTKPFNKEKVGNKQEKQETLREAHRHTVWPAADWPVAEHSPCHAELQHIGHTHLFNHDECKHCTKTNTSFTKCKRIWSEATGTTNPNCKMFLSSHPI